MALSCSPILSNNISGNGKGILFFAKFVVSHFKSVTAQFLDVLRFGTDYENKWYKNR